MRGKPKEWEARLRRRARKREQLQKRRQRRYEERIEPLVAPHAARVRAGEVVPLGLERDLHPNPIEDSPVADEENRLWLAALEIVTARHGITYAQGWLFRADRVSSQLPSPIQILLVPKGFHDPPEAEGTAVSGEPVGDVPESPA